MRSVTYRLRKRSLAWWLDTEGVPTPKVEDARLFTTHNRAERFLTVVAQEFASSYTVERVPAQGDK